LSGFAAVFSGLRPMVKEAFDLLRINRHEGSEHKQNEWVEHWVILQPFCNRVEHGKSIPNFNIGKGRLPDLRPADRRRTGHILSRARPSKDRFRDPQAHFTPWDYGITVGCSFCYPTSH